MALHIFRDHDMLNFEIRGVGVELNKLKTPLSGAQMGETI